MTLHLVHDTSDDTGGEDARRTLAEISVVAEDLRRLVAECRQNPAAMARLTAADIAHAKALLSEARVRLARAKWSIPVCLR